MRNNDDLDHSGDSRESEMLFNYDIIGKQNQ